MTWRVIGVLGSRERPVTEKIAAIGRMMREQDPKSSIVAQPYQDPRIGLAISTGCQPGVDVHRSPDKSLTVVDGEIFNVDEIAQALGKTEADFLHQPARLISRLISSTGVDALKVVDAAASFIHWNADQNTLTIARARSGLASFYWAEHNGFLFFSNDMTALIQCGVARTPDLQALDFFLGRGFLPAPWTLVEAVRKVPAAHALSVRWGGKPSVSRYWQPTVPSYLDVPPTLAERAGEIERLVTQSVRRRTSAKRTNGVLLSGGADSALVLATLAHKLDAPVEAFTFQYGNVAHRVERAIAAAKHFKVRHTVLSCNPEDLAAGLDHVVRAVGEPISYSFNSFLLPQVKAAGVDTVLDGVGGCSADLMGGDMASLWLNRTPRFVQQAVLSADSAAEALGLRIAPKLRAIAWTSRTRVPSLFYPAQMSDTQRRLLYTDVAWFDRTQEETASALQQMALDYGGYSPVDEWRYMSSGTVCVEEMLARNTSWSRDSGVALKSPHFDADLQDYLMRISPEGNGSELLRQHAATLMPPELASVPEKPQRLPVSRWLRGPLKELAISHVTALKSDGFFQAAALDRVLNEHLLGTRDHGRWLWSLMTYSVWRMAVLAAPKAMNVRVHWELELAKS